MLNQFCPAVPLTTASSANTAARRVQNTTIAAVVLVGYAELNLDY